MSHTHIGTHEVVEVKVVKRRLYSTNSWAHIYTFTDEKGEEVEFTAYSKDEFIQQETVYEP